MTGFHFAYTFTIPLATGVSFQTCWPFPYTTLPVVFVAHPENVYPFREKAFVESVCPMSYRNAWSAIIPVAFTAFLLNRTEYGFATGVSVAFMTTESATKPAGRSEAASQIRR